MPVITIAREFGAGGAVVGAMLAERLGIPVADRALIAEVARRTAVPPDEVEAADERPRPVVDRLLRSLAVLDFGGLNWTPASFEAMADTHDDVVAFTEQVIREIARSGDAIIVGRGGVFVLRDLPHALHVFLRAPEAARLSVVRERFELDDEAARRRLREVEAQRNAYIREVYGHDRDDPALYDLVIDTARLGYERTAAAILAALPTPGTARGATAGSRATP
ncbi:MAG TPA: cytidylate kinase-like family protein [Candidatus Limnocylindrales bacterium]